MQKYSLIRIRFLYFSKKGLYILSYNRTKKVIKNVQSNVLEMRTMGSVKGYKKSSKKNEKTCLKINKHTRFCLSTFTLPTKCSVK